MGKRMWMVGLFALGVLCGCEFPRPTPLGGDRDAGLGACAASQPLRCDGDALVSCSIKGTAEVQQPCALGCNASELRCTDVNPSNGLAPYLDLTTTEPALVLGTSATINTDDGSVAVDGTPVVVLSVMLAQTSAPSIRVFIVRGLTGVDVTIRGTHAMAVVSDGEIRIERVFAASAATSTPGPGSFSDGACTGGNPIDGNSLLAGAGGGGFGFAGGRGGSATNGNGTVTGGSGGKPTGNPTLVPLRGGCDSGRIGGLFGAGGGAIQLVSRTQIVVSGALAANGSAGSGGGSGGGILLEAPIVEVSGSVVANGGAGAGGCIIPQLGEHGRLDATPASPGLGCYDYGYDGGNGGAGNTGAGNGISASLPGNALIYAGAGGGGVGRIRVNTAPGGFRSTGLFSPNPSTGTIATR